MKTVLAVASTGGHWIQLRRLDPALNDLNVIYISTSKDHETEVSTPFYAVTDASRDSKLKLIISVLQLIRIISKTKPDVILTTGASVGLLSLIIGKHFGAKTIWIDSIANGDEMSYSGKLAKRWADVWLTQWGHLSTPSGPQYWGSIL